MSDMAMQPAQVQGAPSLPQVNLLPPHVQCQAQARGRQGVVGAGAAHRRAVDHFGGGCDAVGEAVSAVGTRGRSGSQTMLCSHEQTKYAEVPKVLRDLKAREDARTFAMSTEILWSPYLAAISAATPLDASIDNLTCPRTPCGRVAQGCEYGPLGTPGTVGRSASADVPDARLPCPIGRTDSSSLKGVVDVAGVERPGQRRQRHDLLLGQPRPFNLTPDAFANQFVTEK